MGPTNTRMHRTRRGNVIRMSGSSSFSANRNALFAKSSDKPKAGAGAGAGSSGLVRVYI